MVRIHTPGTSASASMSNRDKTMYMGMRIASVTDKLAHAHAHAGTISPASTRTCPRTAAPCRARARGRKGRSVSWTAKTWRGRGCARSPIGRPRRTCLIARIMSRGCFPLTITDYRTCTYQREIRLSLTLRLSCHGHLRWRATRSMFRSYCC